MQDLASMDRGDGEERARSRSMDQRGHVMIWSGSYQEGQTCLHIGHLVPLERSNIAMLLGSSGVVRSSESPLKMFVKC